MKPFRNAGWPYYAKFQQIYPGVQARGSTTYSASTSTPVQPSTNVNATQTQIDDVATQDVSHEVAQDYRTTSTPMMPATPVTDADADSHNSDDDESEMDNVVMDDVGSSVLSNK